MLRPAFLLPPAKRRLLTPRSGEGVSPKHLGPATRRSDAYRGGTCTRWRSAARTGNLAKRQRELSRFVTAHHGAIVQQPRRAPEDPDHMPHLAAPA